MTYTIDTKSRRRPSAKLVAALAVSALLALGTFAIPAYADGDGDGHRRDEHHNWNGGYYRAPPVVYGSVYGGSYYGTPYDAPTYYPPPVVYGPSVGFSIHIR
jgi:hypothetical protein